MQSDRFAAIRPYNDAEVRPVIERLLANPGMLDAIARLRLPRLQALAPAAVRALVRWMLRRQVAGIGDVRAFQGVVEKYMTRMIESTTTAFTVSGLEELDPRAAHLFIGNHRDIALDPAFINYALYTNRRETVRIAIGDNLLTRDYVADLMRLNKSFVVRRSAKGPRQMLAAYRELSEYIQHSIVDEGSSVWIAQREGRAKDGWDRTEPAIIKMLAISKPKEVSLDAHLRQLSIVPVAISYEWDPCDALKARELYLRASTGDYRKAEHEDVRSIAHSITAPKGCVHVSFGTPLAGGYESPEAAARAIDAQLLGSIIMQPTTLAAYRMLHGALPDGFEAMEGVDEAEALMRRRLEAIPPEHHAYVLRMYANPILNRAALDAELARPPASA